VCEYVVTWISDGENIFPERHITVGGKVGDLPIPTLDGYEFLGWWTEPEWGLRITEDYAITSNVTFYAHWKAVEIPVEMVTVVFMDSEDTEFSRITVEKGSVISELPTPQK
jgi:uncharacterized repeat protein (TIGR02543 family)